MKIRFSYTKELIRNWRVPHQLFCALALLLAIPFAAHAQVITASVRGMVTDPQGAAVSGAEVTITNVNTGYTRTSISGSDGEYNFPDLPLGPYKIRASHAGFKNAEQTGIVLHVDDSLVVNVSMALGAVSETVTVEATPIQVETTNGELTGLIEGAQVTELPLNGRNFAQLLELTPGVAAAEAFSTQNKGLKGSSDLSISGGPSNGNLWLVDGGNNNDTGSNRTILIYPSIDSIAEFKVERNSYGAQYGLSAGGQVNIVTKGGSNDFHGSVYYFGRNDKLNAYDTVLKANSPGAAKNKLRRNDFGYTVGGPIKKDKIFFFWSQEWNRAIDGLVRTAHVPTLAERGLTSSGQPTNANFSDIAGASCGQGFPSAGLVDPDPGNANPFTADPSTPGVIDVVPQARVSPVAQLLLSQYPLPTNSNPCVANNWTKSLNSPTFWREESVRGDINITKTLRAMMRFTNDSWILGPPSGGFGWGNNPLGVIDESWDQPGRIVVGRLSKTIGTSAVNDFQFTYSANRITIAQSNPSLVKQLNDAIPPFFPSSGKKYGDQGPSVWFSGWGNSHLPSVWTIAPWANQQDLYTFQDDLAIVKGRHTLKFGAILSRNLKNEQSPNTEFGAINGGVVGFNGCQKLTQPGCGNAPKDAKGNGIFKTGYDISDMILVNMAVPWAETDTIFTNDIRWQNYEAYADDNFRVNNRLTVEFGVRWSFLPNPYYADDKYTSFNPAAFDPALGNAPCNGLLYSPGIANPCAAVGVSGGIAGPNRALWKNNWRAFAPRLGVAWDPTGTGKWAIRAGAGQFFNRDRLHALQIGGANPPFVKNFQSVNGNGRFLDSIAAPPACGTGPCFGTGFGVPSNGNETSDQIPNSWQWNLSVQREVWRDARLEVGYVGNHTLDFLSKVDANPVPVADRLAYAESNASLGSVRPFSALVGNNAINYWTRHSTSSYHSLQSLFNARHGNSTFQMAYTFSKLISNSPRIDSPSNLLVDAFNLNASRGLDPLNRPHLFSASFLYNLPALQGQNSYVRGAFGSWELGTIIELNKGPSMSTVLGAVANVSDPSGVGTGGANNQERPNLDTSQPCRGNMSNDLQWFNPNHYTMNGFQLGTIGTSPVGVCYGPGTSTVDFAVDKNFKLTERLKMQFRMEFFNLFNHPQYSAQSIAPNRNSLDIPLGFNSNGGSEFLDAAGNPTTLSNAVSLQNLTPDPGFGHITQSRETGWRQIQYGLKFIF